MVMCKVYQDTFIFFSGRTDTIEQGGPEAFESSERQICYIKVRVQVGKTWYPETSG